MILIDYFKNYKTFELWDVVSDCKYPSIEFKSLKAAKNYCIKNKLSFKQGLSCDG
tara:strand:- start:307 stop:471 length:165 start_codon:yes stop_codon:yes gene_type:complete